MNEGISESLKALQKSIKSLTRIPSFLIIEDDSNDALLLTRQLQDFFSKCAVIVCSTGTDAFAILEHTEVDAIFLDLRLPEMNGIAVMEKIKSLCETVLIIVTGLEKDSEMTLEAIKRGAVKVIAKPVTQADLKATFGTI